MTLKVTEIRRKTHSKWTCLDFLVALVADTQFASDFLVVRGQGLEFGLDLGASVLQADVDGVELAVAGLRFLVLQLNSALRTQRLLVVATQLFQLSDEGLDAALSDVVLVGGRLQLALELLVQSSELGQLQRLLLDGLLQVDVGAVGNVQRHLEFGDVDLELLLDALDLALQLSLSLNDASIKLFNFNASLLAVKS